MKLRNEKKTLEILKVRLEGSFNNKEHPLVKLTETINWKRLEEK